MLVVISKSVSKVTCNCSRSEYYGVANSLVIAKEKRTTCHGFYTDYRLWKVLKMKMIVDMLCSVENGLQVMQVCVQLYNCTSVALNLVFLAHSFLTFSEIFGM